MPLTREYASAAKPAPGSCVIVMLWILDFSSHANVGNAKSPGTPKLWRTPQRCRYSKRNSPNGMLGENGFRKTIVDDLVRYVGLRSDMNSLRKIKSPKSK